MAELGWVDGGGMCRQKFGGHRASAASPHLSTASSWHPWHPAPPLQAKLEASLMEHTAAEEQLTAELASVKEAAKAAEVGAACGWGMSGVVGCYSCNLPSQW